MHLLGELLNDITVSYSVMEVATVAEETTVMEAAALSMLEMVITRHHT